VQRIENLQHAEKEAAPREAGGTASGAGGNRTAAADRQESPVVLSDDEAEEI
jgi:hypothetical protein